MSGNRMTELCEKLRKWVDCKHDMVAADGFSWLYELTSKEKSELLKIADEIEAEIERDYMKLPIDAEGVPWRDGETMFVNPNGDECRLVSLSFSFIRHRWLLKGEIIKKSYDIQRCYAPDECRHVKTRTIEDVLHDVVSLCFNTWKKPSAFSSYDVDDVMESGNMDEFAKELHELIGDGKMAHGTLTAEQVREAIERHSALGIGNGPIFRDGAYEEIAAELRKAVTR